MVNRLSKPEKTVNTTKPRYKKSRVKKLPTKMNGRPSLAKGNLLLILVSSKFDGCM
jgi:hypothetical protein